jgi:hypothetical protein
LLHIWCEKTLKPRAFKNKGTEKATLKNKVDPALSEAKLFLEIS